MTEKSAMNFHFVATFFGRRLATFQWSYRNLIAPLDFKSMPCQIHAMYSTYSHWKPWVVDFKGILKGPIHLNDVVPTRLVGAKTFEVCGSASLQGPSPPKWLADPCWNSWQKTVRTYPKAYMISIKQQQWSCWTTDNAFLHDSCDASLLSPVPVYVIQYVLMVIQR